tara:strand:+ start:20297 stop:20869 length:573 start_codon:yes stop_codon:yes gene_type:complete
MRTYAEILRPSYRGWALVYDFGLVLSGTLFIALLAQIKISLSFTPVPVTGQTLGVLLTGALLGSYRGTLTILVYLAEGAAGLPVFAGFGFGIQHLLGPTGGYLIGFAGGAYLTGFLAEHGWDRKFFSTVFAMLMGSGVIFLVGVPWLAFFVGSENVLKMGLFPFIPGDIIKAIFATSLLPTGWKLIGDKY